MHEKQTNHPHYGEVIRSPDGRLICHICGKTFTKLGSHVVQKHDITSREYKRIFGLDVGVGLITEKHREHLRGCVMRNYDIVVVQNLVTDGMQTRFQHGSSGRTRDMVSEQTRRALISRISFKS